MEEIIKALKSLPKEFIAAIILELMISENVSYEDKGVCRISGYAA